MAYKRDNNSGRRNDNDFEQQDHTNILRHSLDISNLVAEGGKINKNDPDMVKQRIHDYFELCLTNNMHPTLSELAFSFGIDRQTLLNWVNGGTGSDFNDISKTYIKQAYSMLSGELEQYMMQNKTNIVGAIFLAKNNYGYKDQTETVVQTITTSKKAEEQLLEESAALMGIEEK